MRSGISCVVIIYASLLLSCNQKSDTLFTFVPPDETEIFFENKVEETAHFNIISYEYIYNGGGSAAADFNNDGLQDLFFSGNVVPNRLYINKGNWRFEDISKKAGIMGRGAWKTGVTVADVNADGLPDIYVCYSGPGSDEARANQLFINNGGDTPTFTERAGEFGLDAPGTYSTQASFFDYDLDGDLDMFLLNHAKITYSPFYNTSRLRNLRHPKFGNRLYRNDQSFFHDVSAEAHIHGSGINFGLGVSISDVNTDGWPDIYVTNDYEEQDYFYLNQRDGTFRECLKEGFRHISRFGMGSDAADFNNDGLPDVMVVDMLPEDSYRQKLLKGPDEYDKYTLLRDSGYHHQNMRNMLQVNAGNSEQGIPQFSEVGQQAGVAATDWSWCPLFVDLDNDGWKDLFITNGYLRDYTNLDFLKYTFEDARRNAVKKNGAFDTLALVKQMPSTLLRNYCFQNTAALGFRDVSESWGFTQKSISGSALYVDLDNDGDNDVVVNNINDKVHLYRNNISERPDRHFLKIRLKGPDGNRFAIGAKVIVRTDSLSQLQEVFPARGFQSCVSSDLIFGLGTAEKISSVTVQWSPGRISEYSDLPADSTFLIDYANSIGETRAASGPVDHTLFSPAIIPGLAFEHKENEYVDFKQQYLLPYQLSCYGPCMTTADLNGDGYDDMFIGGASGQAGRLLLSDKRSGYYLARQQPWITDSEAEDTDAAFVDIDADGDQDLVVVSGGAEFTNERAQLLQDRIYLNSGSGVFRNEAEFFPAERSNGSCIAHVDFDKDGDQDVFIGGRSLPGYFPLPAYSHLFRNDSGNGEIKFTDVTPATLKKRGIINSAVWLDYDNDTWPDLVVAGDFTPLMAFRNEGGSIIEDPANPLSDAGKGLWSRLMLCDVDDDGDHDIIAGNLGMNTQLKASPSQPLSITYGDFNEDGMLDPLVTYYVQGKRSIYASRDELLEQLPYLKKRFVKYEQYANARMEDILMPDQLSKAVTISATSLESKILINDGRGRFSIQCLPAEAQMSRVSGIIVHDFDKDGIRDILLGGNFYPFRVQLGRLDAATGLLLKRTKSGGLTPLGIRYTGFFADGDVRTMSLLKTREGSVVAVGINNGSMKTFTIN